MREDCQLEFIHKEPLMAYLPHDMENGEVHWTYVKCIEPASVNVRVIGKRNIVLYLEQGTLVPSKYTAKIVKNKWRFKIKNGTQYDFSYNNRDSLCRCLDEALAEYELLR